MRSLLLHIHGDDGLEARLAVALDLALETKAHLRCIQPIPIDVAAPGDVLSAMAAEIIPALREAAAALRQDIEPRIARSGVAWDWITELYPAGDMIMSHAGLSDLIVLGACEPFGGTGASSLAGQIAIHSRTPVLAVPAAASGFDPAAPVVVAWNGSAEASHALRAAVPLLKRSSSVALVTVEEERDRRAYDLPPTEGAEYLSRHGIACEMVAIPQLGGSIDDALRQTVVARKAGWIVMGAYGHSRLREIVLGGATRSLLARSPVPLFLCH